MQRVALARSLVYQPQLLLLDEPLSNLDAKLRLRLRDDLRRIIKKTGVTGALRDARPGRGRGARRPHRRHARRQAAADGAAGRDLQSAGRSVRRQLHRRLEPARRPRRSTRKGEFGSVEAGPASALSAWLPASVKAGEAVKIAVRPENVRLGANGAAEPNTLHRPRHRPALPGHADRLRARRAGRHGSRRSSSAPACAIRSAATSRSCCRRTLCWAYPAGEGDELE